MIKIANPIYDSVFKYLMEDNDVAKAIISVIIGVEVLELEMRPQEQSTKTAQTLISVFRLDFKALIKIKNPYGDGFITKKVLIELQKSKINFEILRFRKYLANNYISKDNYKDDTDLDLPIITIYFLGFKLNSVQVPVLKIARSYFDISNETTIENAYDTFVELLTHDSFIVQIPLLPKTLKTKLEKVLSVFNQTWGISPDNKLILLYNEEEIDDDTQKMLVKRLETATKSKEVQDQISLEEEIENNYRKIQEEMNEKNQQLEQQQQQLNELQKNLEQKDKEMADLRKMLETLLNNHKKE